MTATQTDQLVENYLLRLKTALRPLPASRRDQLVSEITEHIEEGRGGAQSQSEAAVRELLDRLGDPEDIAAAALADEPSESHTKRLTGGSLIAVVLIVVLVAGVTIAGLLGAFASGGGSSSPDHQPVMASLRVPSVLGRSAAQGTAVLRAVGLRSRQMLRSTNSFPPGEIVAMSPVAGSKVSQGSLVTLTESERPRPTVSLTNWDREGTRLMQAEIAAHVRPPDFAYQSLPVNVAGNGVYTWTMDLSPVASIPPRKPRNHSL
jgi:PASTA domain